MAKKDTITATFLHPRGAKQFEAELGPTTTGEDALDGLVKEDFLDAVSGDRAYVLQHQKTGKSLPLTASLAQSGVGDGDTIQVTETSAGAGS